MGEPVHFRGPNTARAQAQLIPDTHERESEVHKRNRPSRERKGKGEREAKQRKPRLEPQPRHCGLVKGGARRGPTARP